MPTLFYGLIFLLVAAVIFAYFYLKRAQARTGAPDAPDGAETPTAAAPQQDDL